LFLVASTSAIDSLKRLVSEVACYVSSGTFDPVLSLTLLVSIESAVALSPIENYSCRHCC